MKRLEEPFIVEALGFFRSVGIGKAFHGICMGRINIAGVFPGDRILLIPCHIIGNVLRAGR